VVIVWPAAFVVVTTALLVVSGGGRMVMVVFDGVVVFAGRMELVLTGATVKVVLGLSGGGEKKLLAEMGDSEVVGVIVLLRDEETEDEETWDGTRMLGQ